MKNGSFKGILVLSFALLFTISKVNGQDIEPRRWNPVPLDLNLVGAAYVYNKADIIVDPVLKAEDVEADIHVVGASYVTSFKLLDRLARFDVTVPWANGEWTGLVDSEPARVKRVGLFDPVFRVSLNLLGTPAVESNKMREYLATKKVNTVAGIALSVKAPLGEYHSDKIINLGENRFTFRPQIGVVHTRDNWSYEVTGSVFIYTDNTDFNDGQTREQDPIYAIQGHVIYSMGMGKWISFSAGYGAGGKSKIEGISKDDKRYTLLSALSYGMPISQTQAIKFAYIYQTTNSETGADSDSFAASWVTRF